MKKIFTLVAVVSLIIVLRAQTPQLLKNINTTTTDVFSSSFPKKGVVCNGSYFFPATDYNGNPVTGKKLLSFKTNRC
jgi:hypothetical protein